MTPKTRIVVHGLLVLFGLVLMIAGIVSDTHGATGIGLIVAGVNAQQFLELRGTRKLPVPDPTRE